MRNYLWTTPICAFVLALGTGYLRAAEVLIEGDASLFQVVRDAQAANIARFPKGELKARCRYLIGDANAPEIELRVRLCWSGELVFWDFEATPQKGMEKAEKTPYGPTSGRMLYDGSVFRRRFAQRGDSGATKSFRRGDWENLIPYRAAMDLRPTGLWSRCDADSAWAILIGPHPAAPEPAKKRSRKWVVGQDGHRIILQHHQAGYEPVFAEGVTTFVCSTELAGNVIQANYAASDQVQSQTIDWVKDDAGRVILKHYRSHWRYTQPNGENGERLVDVDIESFDGDSTFSPEQFTPAALKN